MEDRKDASFFNGRTFILGSDGKEYELHIYESDVRFSEKLVRSHPYRFQESRVLRRPESKLTKILLGCLIIQSDRIT